MKPGRQLDAKIAKHVVGWSDVNLNGTGIPPGRHSHEWYPHYSTDIAAAWELAEKFHMSVYTPNSPIASGEYANDGNWKNKQEEYLVEVNLVNPTSVFNEFNEDTRAYGLTAPHAICLAALAALGIKI